MKYLKIMTKKKNFTDLEHKITQKVRKNQKKKKKNDIQLTISISWMKNHGINEKQLSVFKL